MFKKVMKRYLSLIIVLAMVLSLLPGGLSMTVYAANLSGLDDENISLTYTTPSSGSAKWEASGTTITGTATGYTSSSCGDSSDNSAETTLQIFNDSSDSAVLSFNWSLENGGSLSIDDEDKGTTGTYSVALADGEYVTVVLTSPEGTDTNTLTISNVKLSIASNIDILFQKAENGSYSVNSTSIDADTTITGVSTDGFSVSATADNGYQFYAWYSVTDESYLSFNASTTLILAESQTVTALFITEGTAVFETGGSYFLDLNEAVSYAQDNGATKITLVTDGTLPAGNYTIPSGITLLIPFDESGTCYTTTPGTYENSWTTPYAYRTLTLADGANITVNGAISVSAMVNASGAGNANNNKSAGSTDGAYGYIYMNSGSQITIADGGNLYCWGYISGDGAVEAESGATVYEGFQLTDFRGGSATISFPDDGNGTFPFTQWYVQNIEASLTLNGGAKEYVFTALYMSSTVISSSVELIGSSDSGMFQLSDGAKLTKTYDASTDRMIYDINGDVSISSISLTIKYIITYTFNSAEYRLPINSNITININSGTTTISQDVDLLPGVELIVDDGAILSLSSGNNLYVYDSEEWSTSYFYTTLRPVVYSPTRTGTRTTSDLVDARIDVNGTIQTYGYLYTTESGANIHSSEGTGKVTMINGAGTATSTYQVTQSDSDITSVSVPITSAQLLNGDGSYVETAGATADTTYTYSKAQEKWVTPCTEHTSGEAVIENEVAATCTGSGSYDSVVYCTVCGEEISRETVTVAATGHSYEAVVTEPTCAEQGYTTYTCTVCGDSYVGDYTETTGHTWDDGVVTKSATCTDNGVMTFTCTVCGETKTDAISATGHTEVADAAVAATCTTSGLSEGSHCTVCNAVIVAQEVIPALGHTYETVVTAPTCTEQGYTTYTCTVCGDSYVSDYTDATGHSYEAVVTAPTCTEQGYTTYTCTVCGDSYVSDYVDALGHSYDEGVVTKEATCTEDGVMTYTCTVCGETKTDTIVATGHTYVGGVTTQATCTEDGVMTYTCSECGDSYTVTIPATGHTVVVDEAVAATCTEDGLTEGSHCSVCGEVLVTQEVIPATGHSYEESVTTPSDTVQCVATYTCATCGDSYTEYITGLYDIGDDTYYLDENSYAVSGLVKIVKDDGEINYYYFRAEGDNEVNTDKDFSGATYTAVKNVPESGSNYWITNTNDLLPEWGYYFDEDGVIIHDEDTSINGIHEDGGVLYYYIDGIKVHYGLFMSDGDYYYAKSDGALVVNQTYWITRTNGLLEEGSYTFDAEGKIVFPETNDNNGIVEENDSLYFYVDGELTYAGLIEIDGSYYYVKTSGEVVHGCTYWITKTNDIMEQGSYTFDEEGKMVLPDTSKNGIVSENDSLYYYVDGVLTYAGLIEIDGGYYYVKTSGEVVHNCSYWITKTNDLMEEGSYTFDDDGKMVLPDTSKNGIVSENESLYYYVDGVLTYAGLIEINGDYYYVKTSGEVIHGCSYWITKTNGLMDESIYTFDDEGKMVVK